MESPTRSENLDENHAVGTTANLPDWVDRVYGPSKPTNVVDELIDERRRDERMEGLRDKIDCARRRLRDFEQHYAVTTEQFLSTMSAAELDSGDLEFIVWTGEARLLEALEAELRDLY